MKREELKYFDCNEDSYDSCGFKFEPMEVYDKAEADSVMDAMEARIKELEDKVQMKDFFWEGSGLSKRGFKNTIEVANYIEDLESRQPKWISVEERFPTNDDYDEVLVDLHEVSDYPIAGVERIRTIQFITDSIAYDADNNCGIFRNVEGMEKFWFTKWMPLPSPPTTEESSVIEEG